MFHLRVLNICALMSTVFCVVNKNERIIHGNVVDIEDFPYQVALVKQNSKRRWVMCGGALIKPRIVFTAAHCTHDRNDEERENFSVLVGANYLGDPKGRFHKIEKVVKHPDFSYDGFDHDFSVLVLEKPVQMTDRAQTVKISSGDHQGGSTATASGWGRTEQGRPSKYLRAADLTLESWDRCQNYFPGNFHPRITKNMVCIRPDRKSTYFGDSGGPLVVNGELVGLVSFGRKLGGNKKTTVFSRVRNFLDFVEDAVPEFKDGE